MVTTRSADKRVDATRGEDLVLRSRTVHSPSYGSPTPSQLRKRRALERGQQDSPRPKRARTGLDGADDEDAIPSTTGTAVIEVLDASSGGDSATQTLDNALEQAHHNRTDSAAEAKATPVAKPSTQVQADSSAIVPDVFMTPATSKHKRFGSEELNEDTIIVNQSTDSSAHNDYHTADEDVEASDDAPEIASAKTPSAKPRVKSHRTPRPKKQTSANTALKQPLSEKRLIEPLPMVEDAELAGQPPTQTAADPAIELETEDTITFPVPELPGQDSMATAPTNHIQHNTSESQAISSLGEEQTVGGPNTNVDEQPKTISDTSGPSSASHISSQIQPPIEPPLTTSFQERLGSSFPHAPKDPLLPKPHKTRLGTNQLPTASQSNLTNRAGKTFESFRRNQLNQRLRHESTWSKKRSTFAVT